MIIPDKKKMATMIVAHLHGAPEESSAEEGGDSYEALADEVLKAVKAGSAKDLAEALKAFHAECESEEDEHEEPEE